ncbi:MAG: RES family NAD+ phosphorylase [Hoeflea sp.]|nr:RES family NAD+ phosphorylase [Hoeflea sp.]
MKLWRISKFADLSGRGGLVVDGRWHRKGTPVVYCCDHPSTALLEILVHMDKSRIPPDFQLLRLDCPDNLTIFNSDSTPRPVLNRREMDVLDRIARGNKSVTVDLGPSRQAVDWYLKAIHDEVDGATDLDDAQVVIELMNSSSIGLDVSQTIGTSLLQERQFPLIRIRSAVMPAAWNFLLNPLHPDAARVTVAETYRYPFDSRLLQ